METERMKHLRERMEKDGKKWLVKVINLLPTGQKIISVYSSNIHKLENILRKIEADLMTNLHQGIETPLVIQIKEERLKNKVRIILK